MSRPTRDDIIIKLNMLTAHHNMSSQDRIMAIDLANWVLDQVEQKPEQAEGVLRPEEIYEYAPELPQIAMLTIINLSRQGMIPVANTVQIPLEKDWPEWAACVQLFYVSNNHNHSMDLINGAYWEDDERNLEELLKYTKRLQENNRELCDFLKNSLMHNTVSFNIAELDDLINKNEEQTK